MSLFNNSIIWRDIGSDLQPPEYERIILAENSEFSPIREAKVSMNGTERIPHWVRAEIYPHHLDTGDATDKNTETKKLKQKIRSRGDLSHPDPDDCGHMIARQLGGKMVDFNLFPQDKKINEGHIVKMSGRSKVRTCYFWRVAIEEHIANFLRRTDPRLNPRVDYQVRLRYGDPVFPNRPVSFEFAIRFHKDEKEDEKKTNGQREQTVKNLVRLLVGQVSNRACELRNTACGPCDTYHLTNEFSEASTRTIELVLKEVLETFCEYEHELKFVALPEYRILPMHDDEHVLRYFLNFTALWTIFQLKHGWP